MMLRRAKIGAACLLAASLTGQVGAQDRVGDAIDAAEQTTRESSRSQQRINRLDDDTRAALEAYRRAIWEAQQLRVYSEQLDELQKLQAAEKADLQAALADVPLKEEDLLPLMLRMVNTLEALVAADMPFLLDEREQRVASLKRILGDGDATLSDQFRRVLEAYQIETDYGRGLDSQRTELDFKGNKIVVDTLRIGRVSQYFLSLDGETGARWDKQQGGWVEVDATQRPAIKQGIRIARETVAPELLVLPVPAPARAGDDS